MSYFAAALTRPPAGWRAAEIDLDDVADLDGVAGLVREVDPDAELGLLFLEADDEFLVIARFDDEDEPRVFGSDRAFATESRVGEIILGDLDPADVPGLLDEDLELMGEPVGDADLLADLGVSSRDLIALCAHEGLLPADVTLEICRKVGCADALLEVREE